jgi:hypothetical protein
MSHRGFMTLIPAALILAGTLAAQPDPFLNCRSHASVLTNSAILRFRAQQHGTLDNGNFMIWWDAKLANGRTVSGFCEASTLDGRIVRLGTNQTDSMNRTYKITADDAERVCAREARARFSPGNGEIGARLQQNISSKSTYRVEWRYESLARTIRKGWCEIDSSTGHIRQFHANSGW